MKQETSAFPPVSQNSDRITAAIAESYISREEFLARQERVRQALVEADLSGAVIWSRAVVDMGGDVLYLSNHYAQQPFLGDEAKLGVARSHAALVVPASGPVTLVTDVPWWRRDLVVADEVYGVPDVVAATADAVTRAGLDRERVALVGASMMSASAYLRLTKRLPHVAFCPEDRLVEPLRVVKSAAEQEIIRESAAVGNRTMEAILEHVVEGATEAEAVAAGAASVISEGGVFYDAICNSGPRSAEFAHRRFPPVDADRSFENGDLFHVDLYGAFGGYFFDFARSRCVGDEPTDDQLALLEALIDGVETVCASIAPGKTAGSVFDAGAEWLATSALARAVGAETDPDPFFPAFGHGLGLVWEPPFLRKGDPTELMPGMHLSVELFLGDPKVGGGMFEHNGLVTSEGFEILSTARERWW